MTPFTVFFLTAAGALAPSVPPASVPEPVVALVLREPASPAPRPSFLDHVLDGSEVALNFGTFGALDTEQVFEVGLELRLGSADLFRGVSIRPTLGASLLDDGGNYLYVGARAEVPLDPQGDWRLGLAFAPGVYSPGGVDLGGPLEFRSGIDLSHPVLAGVRAGAGFYHLSNGGLYSRNGGSESALFSLALEL